MATFHRPQVVQRLQSTALTTSSSQTNNRNSSFPYSTKRMTTFSPCSIYAKSTSLLLKYRLRNHCMHAFGSVDCLGDGEIHCGARQHVGVLACQSVRRTR